MTSRPSRPTFAIRKRGFLSPADRGPAFDDRGDPIPEMEIIRERNRGLPPGFPNDLVPDLPDNCSDEQWDRAMLIEQIKFRRRIAKTAVS